MAVLTIDPSSKVGWARWAPGYDRPRFNVVVLGQADASLGGVLSEYRSWLIDQIIVNDIDRICIERFFMNPGKTDQDVLLQQACIYGVTLEVATGRQIKLHRIDVGTWRSTVLGAIAAPKAIKGGSVRQRWIKDRAMNYCRHRGWNIDAIPAAIRDNAADALCIMEYVRRRIDPSYATAQTPLFSGQE